jgi:hypothetical protein
MFLAANLPHAYLSGGKWLITTLVTVFIVVLENQKWIKSIQNIYKVHACLQIKPIYKLHNFGLFEL